MAKAKVGAIRKGWRSDTAQAVRLFLENNSGWHSLDEICKEVPAMPGHIKQSLRNAAKRGEVAVGRSNFPDGTSIEVFRWVGKEERAKVDAALAALQEDFLCCGGNGETPPQHCQDCPGPACPSCDDSGFLERHDSELPCPDCKAAEGPRAISIDARRAIERLLASEMNRSKLPLSARALTERIGSAKDDYDIVRRVLSFMKQMGHARVHEGEMTLMASDPPPRGFKQTRRLYSLTAKGRERILEGLVTPFLQGLAEIE